VNKPYVATLRPKGAEPLGSGSGAVKVINFEPLLDKSLIKVETIEQIDEEAVSLNRAEAIVAGGRAVKSSDGLEQLKVLVETLKKYFEKVELGASRPLVDARLVPSSRQIGLTGQKVAPQLYIAVGISGSLQHLTGVLGAKKIIAINSDPNAPIFKVADYGVIASFEEIVPALGSRLKELS